MKKWAFRLCLVFLVIIVLAVAAVSLFLDSAIRRGVETVGPMVAKVEVKLDAVSLSLLSGSGKIKGLTVGNPEGFKTPSAIQVGTASLALRPGSIFGDKIIINSINVQGPEITFETDLRKNNLSKILDNLQAWTGSAQSAPAKPGEPTTPQQAKASRKLQVDDFLISGGKIQVSVTALGGKAITVPLPEIHLTGLGQGPEGITPVELAKRVLQEIEKGATQASGSAVTDLSNQAANLTKQVGGTATGAAENITKGIGGLFKKK